MAQVIIKVPPQMFRTGAKHVEAAEESSSTELERFEKLA
jgi:hypothetical protein